MMKMPATYAGMLVQVSEAATALPSAKPRTDDMRDMIDHFHRLGLIKRLPAAFTLGNILVVHPAVYARMEKISR